MLKVRLWLRCEIILTESPTHLQNVTDPESFLAPIKPLAMAVNSKSIQLPDSFLDHVRELLCLFGRITGRLKGLVNLLSG